MNMADECKELIFSGTKTIVLTDGDYKKTKDGQSDFSPSWFSWSFV